MADYDNMIDLDRLGIFKTLADSKYANKGDLPTKTSDLTNDSGFITSSDVPAAPQASGTTPKMNGTAAVGSETAWSRGDHVHPTDTSRASATDLANLQTQVNNITVPSAATTAPQMDGTAAVGSSAKWAKEDHVHPTDTSRAAASTVSALQTTVNGKADKSTTLAGYGIANAYTKGEVDDMLDDITGISFEVVASLPATGSTGTIYLVSNSGSGTNSYDEYIWLSSASRYEKIGTTDVDLSNYVQKTDITLATNAQVQALFA